MATSGAEAHRLVVMVGPVATYEERVRAAAAMRFLCGWTEVGLRRAPSQPLRAGPPGRRRDADRLLWVRRRRYSPTNVGLSAARSRA